MADTINWITAAVIPGLSALAGGLFGTYLGLFKTRKERAFERRVQWYDQMHKAFAAARSAIDRAISQVELGRAPREHLASVLVKQLDTVTETRDDAAMYGSPYIMVYLTNLLAEVSNLFSDDSEEDLSKEDLLKIAEKISEHMTDGRMAVALEMRDELRLEGHREILRASAHLKNAIKDHPET